HVAGSERAQDRADGAGVEGFEGEGEGDELVIAGGHILEVQAFEDGDVVSEDGGVGREVFGVLEVHAGGVDAEGEEALVSWELEGGEGVDELWGEGGEVCVPGFGAWEGAGFEEDSGVMDGGGAAG